MMKIKRFRPILVVSMLAAFLTIGVGISVLEAGDYCGEMLFHSSIDKAFADNDKFKPDPGPSGTLRIYLQHAGENLFTITGNLDDPEGNHRALIHGVGNLHEDETDGFVFSMSLTGTENFETEPDPGPPPIPAIAFKAVGIGELNFKLKNKDGDWWRLSYVYFPLPDPGYPVHIYTFGEFWLDEKMNESAYIKCFDLKDK